jgi:23S rRNA (adenine2503-C2)-methyltransferase
MSLPCTFTTAGTPSSLPSTTAPSGNAHEPSTTSTRPRKRATSPRCDSTCRAAPAPMFEPLARLEVFMFEPLARLEVLMFEPLARLEVLMFEPLARLDKLTLELRDGATIETVLLPRVTDAPPSASEHELLAASEAEGAGVEDDDDETLTGARSPSGIAAGASASAQVPGVRVTQCISTQVGCAMGCTFCASGVAGLKRHLGPDEIVAQVLLGRSLLRAGDEATPPEVLRNVVYMGMGEPLHNYEATARSLRLLTQRGGIGLSTRRVTVSTSGLVPEIRRLGDDFGGMVALAVSLHAADDETRSALMPINRKHPLAELMRALADYPMPPRRRITIEYTLVAGRNDGLDEAKKLVRLLAGLPVKVNLIPMNPIALSSLGPPSNDRVLAFQETLVRAGLSCFLRRRRGDDVSAACGQLALLGAKPKVKGFRPSPEG